MEEGVPHSYCQVSKERKKGVAFSIVPLYPVEVCDLRQNSMNMQYREDRSDRIKQRILFYALESTGLLVRAMK